MKTIFSTIATAFAMAFASGAVSAQPTVSTSQVGTGNSLYVVQQAPDYEFYDLTATIKQTGNNNVAGDPLKHHRADRQPQSGQCRSARFIPVQYPGLPEG
ncbi:MAG TPA: hypothetical protein VF800_04495 [Telluria sp.]|jgi:hypothetical protein